MGVLHWGGGAGQDRDLEASSCPRGVDTPPGAAPGRGVCGVEVRSCAFFPEACPRPVPQAATSGDSGWSSTGGLGGPRPGSDRLPGQEGTPCRFLPPDHQKLEREARICRLLKHSNIGEHRGRASLRPQRPPPFCIQAPLPLSSSSGDLGVRQPLGEIEAGHSLETMPTRSDSPSGFSGSGQGLDVLRLQKSHKVAGYKERRLETKAHGRHSPAWGPRPGSAEPCV